MRHGGPYRVRGEGRPTVLVVALLCLAGPMPAGGQVAPPGVAGTSHLVGTVSDRESEAPISGARIYLLDPSSGTEIASGDSDAAGAFELSAVPDGTYDLRVERIGYRVLSDTVTLPSSDDHALTIYLVAEAIDLEPLVVWVPRTTAYYMRHFETRRTTGSGTFITRAQIERRRARQTSEILHSLAGVRVQYSTRGEAALFLRGTCRPEVYVDGAAIHESVSIDMAVLPDDIEGIEVYSNATIPAQYATTGACGAILVWTRPAVRGEGRGRFSAWKVILTAGVFLTVLILRH